MVALPIEADPASMAVVVPDSVAAETSVMFNPLTEVKVLAVNSPENVALPSEVMAAIVSPALLLINKLSDRLMVKLAWPIVEMLLVASCPPTV